MERESGEDRGLGGGEVSNIGGGGAFSGRAPRPRSQSWLRALPPTPAGWLPRGHPDLHYRPVGIPALLLLPR